MVMQVVCHIEWCSLEDIFHFEDTTTQRKCKRVFEKREAHDEMLAGCKFCVDSILILLEEKLLQIFISVRRLEVVKGKCILIEWIIAIIVSWEARKIQVICRGIEIHRLI